MQIAGMIFQTHSRVVK
ncbi:DUF6783 domain-containing protein [Anaerobutyricum hallii]